MSKKLRAVFLVILGVLALCCFGAFAACGNSPASSEQPPQDVAVDTISYDGSVFKWGQVQGTGISYKITVNDGMEIPTTALSYAYPTTSNVTVYTISVKAINQYGESNPVSRTFYQMETIEAEDLTFDAEGTMTWQPVPNAVSYIVEVNGREIPVSSTEFSDFEYGQRNSIRVKPVGADSSYFSKWTSSSVSKTYLAQPDNIKYDGQFITWSGSPSASSYAVYINGNLYQEGIRQAQVEYDAQNASFDVSVQAEGDGSQVFSSQVSSESNFIYLGAVTGISVNEDAVLVWNEVEGADYYSLEYTYRGNTTTIKPDGNSYDGLPAGASIDVRIRPMINGDNENSSVYYSTWSERVTVAILQAPSPKWNSSFSLTDGQEARALYWDSVTLGDVSAYNVKVVFTPSSGSGQSTTNIYSATADNPSFSFAYTEVGTYKISLQAVAEVNSDWSNSRYSGEMTVIRLAAPNRPTNDEFIESNPRALNEGFKVSYEGVSGASGYRLLMDGAATAYTSTSQSISVKDVGANNSQQTQTIHYAIQSIGSVKSVGNLPVVTLDSLTASSLQFEIQVLAMPQNLTVSGGVLRWNTVTGANGYAVDMGVTQSVNGTEFSLENNIQAEGDYQVSVCACGNSAEVLASAYSQNINVVKLSAPYNVRISTGENEGTLLWDGPLAGVTSYNIFFNGSNDPVSNSNLDNINRYIVSNGVTVVVQAIANAWNADQTVYYLNSNRSQTFQFIKLLPVTFPSPAFTDTNFIWEAPANVGNANITYTVEMDGYTLNGVADGASYDISAVAAGPHTFRVRAIGDGSSTISSDWSAAVDIIKLETPEVTRTQTQYEWPSVIGATGYQVYVDNVLAQTIARVHLPIQPRALRSFRQDTHHRYHTARKHRGIPVHCQRCDVRSRHGHHI